MRLVLFDIDGTLLTSEGMGRAAMRRALGETFGSPGNPAYRYDGKTDKQIVRDVMRLEGHSDLHIDAKMEKLIEVYLDGLRSGAKSGEFNVSPLEGVVEVLDALDNREDVVLGLLTGNVEPGARIKLTAAGIKIATGPFAKKPKPIVENVTYSHSLRPVSRCSHAANIAPAISILSSASAVAARPIMYTPSDMAVMPAASSAVLKPKRRRANR